MFGILQIKEHNTKYLCLLLFSCLEAQGAFSCRKPRVFLEKISRKIENVFIKWFFPK